MFIIHSHKILDTDPTNWKVTCDSCVHSGQVDTPQYFSSAEKQTLCSPHQGGCILRLRSALTLNPESVSFRQCHVMWDSESPATFYQFQKPGDQECFHPHQTPRAFFTAVLNQSLVNINFFFFFKKPNQRKWMKFLGFIAFYLSQLVGRKCLAERLGTRLPCTLPPCEGWTCQNSTR